MIKPPLMNLRFLYRYIFFIFAVCGIYVLPFSFKKRKYCTWISFARVIYSSLATLLLIGFTIYIIINMYKKELQTVAVMSILLTINRVVLCSKCSKIRAIMKYFCFKKTQNYSNIFWMNVWTATCTSAICIKLIIIIYWSLYMGQGYIPVPVHDEHILQSIEIIAFLLVINIHIMLPIDIFIIVYSIVCFQLREYILKFVTTLTATSSINYQLLLDHFFKLKKISQYVDDAMSCLVFISTIYNGVLMYFVILSIRSEYYPVPDEIIHYLSLFLNTIGSVIMISSAAFVEEASKTIWEKAQKLPESKQQFLQQKFLAICKRGISMTIWKFVPIRRIIILTNFGTVFTYILLIDGLEK